jgi:hypothetical protein
MQKQEKYLKDFLQHLSKKDKKDKQSITQRIKTRMYLKLRKQSNSNSKISKKF